MNLTLAEVMIDPWSDGRSASREKREKRETAQDRLRLHASPHQPLRGPSLSDAERSPMEKHSSNHPSFPDCDDDPLSVLAYAGRLVDGGADYPA